VNVLVYVSDALRADHVGCYGARFLNTRTIDELAATGIRFDQAISAAPWTAPSMLSIVTGLYPHHHGQLHWDSELDPSLRTLFHAFADGGYAVGSFVFDEDYLFNGLEEARVLGTSETLDGAASWLRANRSGPFFLLIHSWTTHMPYQVVHAEREEWGAAKRRLLGQLQENTAAGLEACREAYRAAVEHQSETLVASLLDELDRLGLRERTAIAFLSDHGESWGERLADKEDVQGIYHLHGATLYDEILQVPLIVAAPGHLDSRVVEWQVRTVDLTPTLLELAGLPAGRLDGSSLLPLLDGREEADRVAVAATSDRGVLSQMAIRLPPWKVIRHLDDGSEEAYRVDVDPRERVSRPEEAPAELRALLNLEVESAERHELSADEEAIVAARLADLGYL
jgi:arylsulfatase A-like enzyme